MRVLTIRFSWQPGRAVGGAEQSAVLHGRLLNKLGHHGRVISNFGVDERNKVFTSRIWMPSNKILGQLVAFLTLPVLAVSFRPDVINPHSRFDQIALSLTKWLHRKPVVWKDPGDLKHHLKIDRKKWLAKLNQKLYLAAIKKADAIYTLNQGDLDYLAKLLEKFGLKELGEKFEVVPSDISFDDYNLDANPPQTKAKLVIGYVGRTDEFKGVQYLIKAYKDMEIKDAELWIVGDGDHLPRLKKLAEERDDIKFWGYKTQVSPYLNGLDIFVQPAEFEGWGRNVKEAMYFSLPVIGSDVGGIARQIDNEQTGLLFEPKNVDQLQERLERLIGDSQLRSKLGAAAHKQALASGDYETLMSQKIIPIFERFVD